ncbi:MAG: AAA family ATPase [Deltaproteobacteria bacterium]|nr:AAA family ATPase [Deltaproteobacteria bacterium]
MKDIKENMPSPKELEKEISDFLAKRFGNNVKLVPPVVFPQQASQEASEKPIKVGGKIQFDLKPEELIAYLDHYIIKQDQAKAVLATKICTHFNRVKRFQDSGYNLPEMVGQIKNNVLMMGPTGVGKTYMVKLIAQKIGVPFVKGDATKFSETGYVGGDVEDLIRDLVREADGDIELAQYGIVYIDEIDKIASSRNLIGADVSRTGVQRALLKPMEETEVDLKVPHDPISMLQEIERFRKTGKRESSVVNTKHILFIVSGAFQELPEIISKRLVSRNIGFGAAVGTRDDNTEWLKQVQSEDLIHYGFESEFVGRLPVRAIFERLTETDLFDILKNPNNPIILGKKLDFNAYDIDIKFDDALLKHLATIAHKENTGARGLVSAVETALMDFEKRLPSLKVSQFPATGDIVANPGKALDSISQSPQGSHWSEIFAQLVQAEKRHIAKYLEDNWAKWADQYPLSLTAGRIEAVATCFVYRVMDITMAIEKVQDCYDQIKQIELQFFKNNEINIVFEEAAIDYLIEKRVMGIDTVDSIYQRLTNDFEHGFRLILEKTGKNRFFLPKDALIDPETYLDELVRTELKKRIQ